jgi:ABC-type bacteriocin/lantibiotic exporter with double-glycine peptidase domain
MRLRVILALSIICTLCGAACGACVFAARAEAIWIDVPFVAQSRDGCGSASISMVMRYWAEKDGKPSPSSADPQEIQAALFSPGTGGIRASSMEKYLRESGFRAFAFQAQWSDLAHHLELGRPLIVGLEASGPLGPSHYAVVVGIDPARGFLFLNDSARGKMVRISRKGFEAEWSRTRNWTLLAVPAVSD